MARYGLIVLCLLAAFHAAVGQTMVSDCTGLQAMQSNLAGSYELAGNIDCSATSTWNSGAGFLPVGSDSAPFTGDLEGNGYTITTLFINRPSTNYIGVFGYLGTGATVSNLILDFVDITGRSYVAGLAGASEGTITSVTVAGTAAGYQHIGGVCGRNDFTVQSCSSSVSVSGTTYAGSLIGTTEASSVVSNSYASGTATTSGSAAGGLIGAQKASASVTSCYATGNIDGNSNSGGLVGDNLDGTILNSYATGDVSGVFNTGGLLGSVSGNLALIQGCHATGAVSGGVDTGGLIGDLSSNGAAVRDSYALGTVSSTSIGLGGLIGTHRGIMERCYAANTVQSVDTLGPTNIGGLVGENYGSIANSYAMTTISGTGSKVGGLVGLNDGATITDCYSMGVVSGLTEVGGLVGVNDAGTVSDCFWDVDTSNQATSAAGTGYPRSTMWQQATYTGWNFASIWSIDEGNNYPLLSGLADQIVTPPDPFPSDQTIVVSNCAQLQAINDNLAANYVLQNNIDCSPTFGWNSGAGFLPLGSGTAPFTGEFDGNGYQITSLFINRPTTRFVGLFGAVSVGATLRDVTLNFADVTGETYTGGIAGITAGLIVETNIAGTVTTTYQYTGGLTGRNYFTVQNCSSSVTVAGHGKTGGLIGVTEADTVVRNCYATGGVTSTGTATGGLVGEQRSGATIIDCYASGTVDASSDTGGLVGSNFGGTLLTSYAIGDVTGSFSTGGLLGAQTSSTAFTQSCYALGAVSGGLSVGGLIGEVSDGQVRNAFARGDVTGSSRVGGAVGRNFGVVRVVYSTGFVSATGSDIGGLVGINSDTVDMSYWDTETSGQAASSGGTGKTTPEMKQQATFVGWDFVSTWEIIEDVTYPQLNALWDPPTASPSQSISVSQSRSQTQSFSPPPTQSPSRSPPRTDSMSQSASPTPSKSQSQSRSPTPSNTPPESMSNSPSQSASRSPSAVQSETQSFSAVPTSTARQTQSQSQTPINGGGGGGDTTIVIVLSVTVVVLVSGIGAAGIFFYRRIMPRLDRGNGAGPVDLSSLPS